MKVLLFAGAGTSVELGVPAMAGLATEFRDHCRHGGIQADLVEKLLKQNGMDLEMLIEILDQLNGAAPALKGLGETVNALEPAAEAHAEVEWFVQHLAERVKAQDAALMWGPVISAGGSHDLTVATTNYDRAVEMAAKGADLELRDGFDKFSEREFASWEGVPADRGEGVRLLKLHGSTDWYSRNDSDEPVKLRHPVALYGRYDLRLPSNGQNLRSALILPSREKRLTHEPYMSLSQAFLNEADQCDVAIFAGSSLRDPHIKTAAQRTVSRGVPTFIVDPKENPTVAGAQSIRQCASMFLISTLPKALTGDVSKALNAVADRLPAPDGGILDAVRILSRSEGEPLSRRDAIERVDATGATLGIEQIEKLLADEDASVAKHALSLVYGSPHVADLLKAARKSPHSEDKAYGADLALLMKMLKEA
ncbi:MAG: SIR2 family protein [Rhodospirillaceae bacterium]|nr:SIR2 family protein [Rhodospirillaceae bacterium]